MIVGCRGQRRRASVPAATPDDEHCQREDGDDNENDDCDDGSVRQES
jgi:hypothetical protein